MRTGRAGFSIIEVMVAVLIIGLVMGSIYGALVGTVRTKEVVEKELDDVKQGSVLFDMLRRDLASACLLRPGVVLFKCKAGDLTSGGGGRVSFLASRWTRFPDDSAPRQRRDAEDEPPPRSPLCEVSYVLTSDARRPGRYTLWRREDYFLDQDFEKGGLYLKLSEHVTELTLTFYTGDEQEKNSEPAESWDGEKEERLPRAVGIRLVVNRAAGLETDRPGDEGVQVFEAVVPLLAGDVESEDEEEEKKDR